MIHLKNWKQIHTVTFSAEDVVPRILASPQHPDHPDKIAAASLVALQPASAAALPEETVAATLDLFGTVFEDVAGAALTILDSMFLEVLLRLETELLIFTASVLSFVMVSAHFCGWDG